MATIGPLFFVGSPWRRRAVPPGPMPEPPSRRGAGQRSSRGSSRLMRFSTTALSPAALTLVAVTMAAVGLLAGAAAGQSSDDAQTSADDANGLPAIRAGHEWLDPTFFPCGIRDELFNRTDGDGAVAGKFNDAIALAQAILRKEATADLGPGRGRVG